MNRPIDWKKLADLKRQAPPPDVPLGDMLMELLEGESGRPVNGHAEAAAIPVEMNAPALDPAQLAADELTPDPSEFTAEFTMEAPQQVDAVTPDPLINSKVEMALSELSEISIRYEAAEQIREPEDKPEPEPEPEPQPQPQPQMAEEVPALEDFQIPESFAASLEPQAIASLEVEPDALQPSEPEIAEASPTAEIEGLPLFTPPAMLVLHPLPKPHALSSVASPPDSGVDDLLAMLLGSDSKDPEPAADLEPPLEQFDAAAIDPTPPLPAPAEPAAMPAETAKTPVSPEPVELEYISSPDMDELISAMDREVESSPFEEKTGALTQSRASEPLVSPESCLVFSLAGIKYGIPIKQVVEMDKLPRVTPVPNVPFWVRGVTNIRGDIVSVLDLRLLLGLESRDRLERCRMLIVRLGEDQITGLVVDDVSGISGYAEERLAPPGADENEKVIALLDGIYSSEELALKVMNMDKLMATPELRQLEAT